MKKTAHLLLPLLLVFSTSFLHAPPRSRDPHKKINRLILGKCKSNPKKQQRALIALFKDPTQVSGQFFFASIDLLIDEGTFPFLTRHNQTIDSAIDHFKFIPGFTALLRHLICNHDKPEVKGTLYELEKAVEIEQQENNERVIAFHEEKQSATARREFDIITNRRWIECKNISWRTKKKKQKKQFLDQKAILKEHNRHKMGELTYLVCSKTEIREEWKEWFKQHAIPFWQDPQNPHQETAYQ